jgi:hypothetical protein
MAFVPAWETQQSRDEVTTTTWSNVLDRGAMQDLAPFILGGADRLTVIWPEMSHVPPIRHQGGICAAGGWSQHGKMTDPW